MDAIVNWIKRANEENLVLFLLKRIFAMRMFSASQGASESAGGARYPVVFRVLYLKTYKMKFRFVEEQQ